MRKILLLLLSICLCATYVAAQKKIPRVKNPVPNRLTQMQLAERAWKPFFEEFRRIVRARDREGMGKMISKDYSYPCGSDDVPCGQREVGINELFRDDEWQNIEQVIAKGATKLLSKRTMIGCYGEVEPISKVSPGYWNSGSKSDLNHERFVVFGFQGGRWFFIAYGSCQFV